MKKTLKYIIVTISCVAVLSLPLTAMAYDVETSSAINISNVQASQNGIIVNVSHTTEQMYYNLWMHPDYSTLMLTFRADFPQTVRDFRLSIPIDFSFLDSAAAYYCTIVDGGDLQAATALIDGDTVLIVGTNPQDTSYFICNLYFNVEVPANTPGYIHFGTQGIASYNVNYSIDDTREEFDSANSELNEHLQFDPVEPPDISTPDSSQMQELSGFMTDVWNSLQGWQVPIMLSAVLGALGFMLALKGGAG